MKYKLLDIRLNQRPEDVLDYLNALFPDIEFTSGIEQVGNKSYQFIYTDVELSDTQAREVYQKLKLTSLHFVDRNNYIYN